jgi:HK97 family phage major capsid protein
MTLKEKLLKELERVQTEARAIAELDERSDAQDQNLKDLLAEAKTLQARADEYAAIESMTGSTSRLANVAKEQTRSDAAASMGEQFTRSEVFSEYRGRGTSARLEVRALPTGLAEIADVLPQKARVDATAPSMTPLLDVIGTVTVSQNGIEVVEWTKAAGGAAKVAEKAPKPSVEFEPTVTPYTLDTIAAYTQLTRQLIEDAPAVRSTIDSELRREIALKLEAEAAAALVAATLPTAQGATLLAGIRKGVGVVQAAGYNPNAVILNPADWADLDIDVFTGTLNGAVIGQRFWGLTPIAAPSQPAGTATVGDMSAGVQHYSRTGISLYVTDSHADTFLANVFTLLAEARAKTVVTRPAALVECTKSA